MLGRMVRRLVIGAVAIFGIAGVALAWLWYSGAGCANTIQQRLVSPDGRREVIIFERDCGATTDYSTQVSVLPRGARLPNRPANAYIFGHRVPLSVRWEDTAAVSITYPPGFRGLTERPAVGGVTLRYAEDRRIREP